MEFYGFYSIPMKLKVPYCERAQSMVLSLPPGHQGLRHKQGIKMLVPRAASQLQQVKQHRRTAEAGRDLWKSSAPIAQLRQGHLEQLAQDLVQHQWQNTKVDLVEQKR